MDKQGTTGDSAGRVLRLCRRAGNQQWKKAHRAVKMEMEMQQNQSARMDDSDITTTFRDIQRHYDYTSIPTAAHISKVHKVVVCGMLGSQKQIWWLHSHRILSFRSIIFNTNRLSTYSSRNTPGITWYYHASICHQGL